MGELRDILLIFFVFGGGLWVLSPLARALAKRIAEKTPAGDVPALEEVRSELQEMRRELTELAERVDFTERLLSKQDRAARLAPPH